jgi:antitoxin HicB
MATAGYYCGLRGNRRYNGSFRVKLKVLVRPEPGGGYSVSVPAMPGCHSQGESLDEALTNIREAADLWSEVVAERAAREPN